VLGPAPVEKQPRGAARLRVNIPTDVRGGGGTADLLQQQGQRLRRPPLLLLLHGVIRHNRLELERSRVLICSNRVPFSQTLVCNRVNSLRP